MADLSSSFLWFSKTITPTKTDISYLRKARRTITEKLRLYFKVNNLPAIRFEGQGSFTMGTIIRSTHNPFDIDIGVYLMGMGNNPAKWHTPETVSQWLVKALNDHTSHRPVNKRKCVRIMYLSREKIIYHVDLPVYIEYINFWDNKRTRIGVMGDDQWSNYSNPTGFTRWFNAKCQINDKDRRQLNRIVQYAKAWKEHKGHDIRFPSGMALTVLLAKNYTPHQREDVAFMETIRKAYNWMNGFFWINDIENPVHPYNDLQAKFSTSQKEAFLSCLGTFVDSAKLAVATKEVTEAKHLWQSQFGQQFPGLG